MSQIQVPEGWELKKLGDSDVSEIIMGQSPPGSTYNKDGIGLPFFQGKTNFGEKYPEPTTWCSEPKKIALKDDILISVRAPVGPTNWAKEECCIGRGISAIRAGEIIGEHKVLFVLDNETISIEHKAQNRLCFAEGAVAAAAWLAAQAAGFYTMQDFLSEY